MIIREVVYAALWTLGSTAGTFASANRRLRHWTDVAPIEQPALFMSEKGGHAVIQALARPLRGRFTPTFSSTSIRATLTQRRRRS
jgi:hypothetical protein